jgi:hypothetical protein
MKRLIAVALCMTALTGCATTSVNQASALQSQRIASASKKAPFANEILLLREVDSVKRDGANTLLTFEGEEFDRVFIVDDKTVLTRAGKDDKLTAADLEVGQRLTVDAYRMPRVDGKMPCRVLKIKVH